jgi:membrane-bound inhibitor of C-type lysozyme
MKTIRFSTLLLPVTALPIALAIATVPVQAQGQDQELTTTYRYQCSEGRSFEAAYSLDSATVQLEGETLTLDQIPAASGTRYSDGSTTLYTKGEEAFIEVDGATTYDECMGEAIAGMSMASDEPSNELTDPTPDPTPDPTTDPTTNPTTEATPSQLVTYECSNGQTFVVEYSTEMAELTLDGSDPIVLSQVASGSGARYSNGTTTLYTQGEDAFIEVEGDRAYDDCVAAPSPDTMDRSEADDTRMSEPSTREPSTSETSTERSK